MRDKISAFQMETDRGFMVIIILIAICSIFILPLLNETIVYSRDKKCHSDVMKAPKGIGLA